MGWYNISLQGEADDLDAVEAMVSEFVRTGLGDAGKVSGVFSSIPHRVAYNIAPGVPTDEQRANLDTPA